MCRLDSKQPASTERGDDVSLVIRPRARELGDLELRRVLPAAGRTAQGLLESGQRHVPCNFVSSSRDRIDQAKAGDDEHASLQEA